MIEEGTPDERKRLIRTFVGEIHLDAAKKSIRVGFYEMPGSGEAGSGARENSPLSYGAPNGISAFAR